MSEDLSYIVEDLRPLAVDIDSVHLDPANLRLHDAENIAAIRGSLARFGQRKPIVVNREGSIIEAGNGTWKAAKALGWSKIAAVFVEDDPTTATGYAISDNRAAELAEWDNEALARVLSAWMKQDRELLEGTGWSADDVDALLFDLNPQFEPVDEEEQPRLDEKKKVVCPECGHEFAPE